MAAVNRQAMRAGGLGFLALYAHGVLPGVFAWPAGLGDIAIGVTAPWVALALVRKPGFAASPVFVSWNWLGILDLVVAVSVGGLSSLLASGAAGSKETDRDGCAWLSGSTKDDAWQAFSQSSTAR